MQIQFTALFILVTLTIVSAHPVAVDGLTGDLAVKRCIMKRGVEACAVILEPETRGEDYILEPVGRRSSTPLDV
ncbi:hypothetical protein FB45DRAFT_1062792 [Roridomyces roridus]|uniref:Uncharacterized protein n=1 Tax=Roridomyces roridus TaxID=1738132 RepID=A0AAD7BFH0_9AGAR|nr:hypothetical protein FB45DRAFT_1062792 [Roridomyces roridus]